LEADVAQRRHAAAPSLGQRREARTMSLDRVCAEAARREPLQPGAPVWREGDQRRIAGAHDLVALEYHVVLAAMQRDAGVGQLSAHVRIRAPAHRAHRHVRVHRLRVQLVGQQRNLVARAPTDHDQSRACHAVRVAERAQLRVEVDQAAPNEFDAAIAFQTTREQRVSSSRSSTKDGMHATGRFECVVQRRMVVGAQVSPEPHQCGVEGFVHLSQCEADGRSEKSRMPA
jgi:hypothetical protein